MSQDREPPAYQEYAASMMARVEYRVMKLAERGLLYSLRLECWVNKSLPSDPATLAKILSYDRAEIEAALPAVMPFFEVAGGSITCPELENYRAHLSDRIARMSQGGKHSAEAKKGKRSNAKKPANTGSASTLQAPSEAPCKVLVQSSTEKQSQIQPIKKGLVVDPVVDSFVADMVAAEQRSAARTRVVV